MKTSKTLYDVIIVGGSFAGLSASLALGRSLRKVAVIDAGKPCNRFAPESHNFIGYDGMKPLDVLAKAKKDVEAYPTVSFVDDIVIDASGEKDDFQVVTKNSGTLFAKRLLFTSGVADHLPSIKGFDTHWGKSIIHCPYCHGYEYKHQCTGVYCNEIKFAALFLKMIRNWSSKLTLFTSISKEDLPDEELQSIHKDVVIIRDPILEIKGDDHISSVVVEGRSEPIPLDVLYAKVDFSVCCSLPFTVFNCEKNDFNLIKVDQSCQTSYPGVYAAGDSCDMRRSIAMATFFGQIAGVSINHDLLNLFH